MIIPSLDAIVKKVMFRRVMEQREMFPFKTIISLTKLTVNRINYEIQMKGYSIADEANT